MGLTIRGHTKRRRYRTTGQ